MLHKIKNDQRSKCLRLQLFCFVYLVLKGTCIFILVSMMACRFLKQVLFTDRQPTHWAQDKQHRPQLQGGRDANTNLASEHQ